jgi:hypothetical protein
VTALTVPTLLDFEGTWSLTRRIIDHRAGSTGMFEGTATFTRDDGGLAYCEVGSLHLPNHPPFSADAPNATHWCDPDTYNVSYTFDVWPRWQSTWDVRGPKKAYKMVSDYRPSQP